MLRAWWIVGAVALGCAAAEPAPPAVATALAAPQPSVRPVVDAAADAAPAADAGAAAVALTLEPLAAAPALEPVPVVEIRFPFAEQAIPIPKAPGYNVRLTLEHWPPNGGGGELWLLLDDHPPRRSLGATTELALATLVPEDRELLPGEHFLVAALVLPGGRSVKPGGLARAPFAAVHFWIGAAGTPAIDVHAPMLVLIGPRGTLNGDAAADAALIDFILLNAGLAGDGLGIKARLSGPGGEATARSADLLPLGIRGLTSGDWDVEVSLVHADGSLLAGPKARAVASFVVNRDARVQDGGKPR